jgi:hypothetical protein
VFCSSCSLSRQILVVFVIYSALVVVSVFCWFYVELVDPQEPVRTQATTHDPHQWLRHQVRPSCLPLVSRGMPRVVSEVPFARAAGWHPVLVHESHAEHNAVLRHVQEDRARPRPPLPMVSEQHMDNRGCPSPRDGDRGGDSSRQQPVSWLLTYHLERMLLFGPTRRHHERGAWMRDVGGDGWRRLNTCIGTRNYFFFFVLATSGGLHACMPTSTCSCHSQRLRLSSERARGLWT